jgi:Bacteriophage probable baseplate hub protein
MGMVAGALGTAPAASAATAAARARAQTQLRVRVGGRDLPAELGRQIVVDQDLDQPDMATVTLHGSAALAFVTGVAPGDALDVQAEPASPMALFKGEVVGIEPVFDPLNPRAVIRALNRLHRLAGPPQTKTYENVSDADIAAAVAREHGLVPVTAPELQERYEAVYQHNQTDLEFLRARAARIGYAVWCEDTKLFFARPPALPAVGLAPTRTRSDARLRQLHPRLATSQTVQRVVVRGFDPIGKRDVVGAAAAATLLLRAEPNTPGVLLGETEEVTVEEPVASSAEARALAQAELAARLAARVDAEAETDGSDALRPGRLVVVQGMNDRFNGQYFVQGVSHRYSHSDTCPDGGYQARLRLRRQAPALFFMPEIDDEVLVAFEQGDLSQPYVVGSLWDGDEDRCSTRR